MDRELQLPHLLLFYDPLRRKETGKMECDPCLPGFCCYSVPRSSVLFSPQHCHGNDQLPSSHKLSPPLLWSALLKKGAAFLELHSWGSRDVCPEGRSMEKSWHWEMWPVATDVAKGWDEQLGKCSVVRHDGKNPLLLPISSVIAGIRENLDISKAWRDFSWGLCLDKVRWAGFKAQSLS